MNRQQRRAAERARAKAAAGAARARSAPPGSSPAERALSAGRYEEAERRARQALGEHPDDAATRATLVRALWRQGRLDEAMLEARRLIRTHPDDPTGHEFAGFILHDQDRMPEAAASFEKALDLAPDRWRSHVGLGNSLSATGLFTEALEHHERAVELAPQEPGPCNDLALTRLSMGEFETAAVWFGRATELAADPPALLQWNRALALLGAGDLAQGWPLYDTGFEAGARAPRRTPNLPRWQGQDLAGQRLFVWREQGLGDELRFASCYPDVIDRAAEVLIEATPRLVPLLARSFPGATVRAVTLDHASEKETDGFEGLDVHCPAGSLARYVRPSLASFPDRPHHLAADAQQRERFRERLAALGSGPKVGISWRSMKLETQRLHHYTTLDEWDPVLRLPGVTFVNLQYGGEQLREQELEDVQERIGTTVHRWDDVDYTRDLDAVAGLTAELDVVVGPNTFASILAEALGVPTLMLGLRPVWLHGQEASPWSPTTTHHIRRWDEPWEPAMRRLADDLQRRIRQVRP